jgi:hypothetical protein
LKDIFRRPPLLEIGSERVLREVYSSLFGVIGQGIDDQFDVFSGGCCLSSRRHEENGSFTAICFRLGSSEGRENKGSVAGYKLMIWGEDSRYGRRKAVEVPTRQDIDAGDLAWAAVEA